MEATWEGGLSFGAVRLPVRMRMGPGVTIETPSAVHIVGFVVDQKLRTKPLVAPCYLAPADPACRGYSVLCHVLQSSGQVALVRIARPRGALLAPLRVHMGALVVDLACW